MPIYEYRCQSCKHRWDALSFSTKKKPKGELDCPRCGDIGVLLFSPPRVRVAAPPSKASEHIYEDTVAALGIQDFANPKPDNNDSDWEAPYDSSWEDDE